jgi:demethylmenaquinone methyltransferase/2-methoxy-6-polyprenyl-1,4-benzoquinol methylase
MLMIMNSSSSISAARSLFDAIAPRYDLINHLLTCGIDILWRRKAVGFLGSIARSACLDAAAGTGDLSILMARRGACVTGVDISERMLAGAKRKCEKRGLSAVFHVQNCEALDFPAASFDAAVIGFGIRNTAFPEKALSELFRVLRPGGTLVVLEFSRPENRAVRMLFDLYFVHLLPLLGGLISGHKAAYRYLPRSVLDFPCGERFAATMRGANFSEIKIVPLTLGIAAIYRGTKK